MKYVSFEPKSLSGMDGSSTMPSEQMHLIRRLAGLCGLIGALLFFSGDMLFYGHLGSGSGFAEGMHETVLRASQNRLFLGGAIGPLAACMCIIGFWHVYHNVRPARASWGKLMFAAFFMLMVAGSAVHTLWTARGLALKYCAGETGPCSALLTATHQYWSLMYKLSAMPGYLGALLLFGLVVTRGTYYPRWTAVTNPAVMALLSPLASSLPFPIGAIIVGGFTNLSIALFFLVSIASTWDGNVTADARNKI